MVKWGHNRSAKGGRDDIFAAHAIFSAANTGNALSPRREAAKEAEGMEIPTGDDGSNHATV